MKTLFFILTFLLPICSTAQHSIKAAVRKLDDGDFEKVEQLTLRSLSKDSINPAWRYVYSKLFLSTGFSRYNIDSAHFFIQASIVDYGLADEKLIEKIGKLGVNDSSLHLHKAKVDSAGYAYATMKNTEQSYNKFIRQFHGAAEMAEARLKRNRIAYNKALSANNAIAFKQFMNTYPLANEVASAKKIYDQLLYEEGTSDKTLDSFVRFVSENPNSPYRKEAEKHIFLISTASNKEESYHWFINKFPKSPFAKVSIDLLYHSTSHEATSLDNPLVSDSLQKVIELEKTLLIPIYQNAKYGFIDEKGGEVIPPMYRSIQPDYLCDCIEDDYIIILQPEKKVVGKNGQVIFKEAFEEVEDLGYGFLLFKSVHGSQIIHKSGYQPYKGEVFEAVKLFGWRFVLFQKDALWGLGTMAGKVLLSPQFDDIFSVHDYISFKKKDRFALALPETVAAIADNNPFQPLFKYESVEAFAQQAVKVGVGSKTGIVDNALKAEIPTQYDRVHFVNGQYLAEKDSVVQVFDENLVLQGSAQVDSIAVKNNWLAFSKNGLWGAVNTLSGDSTQIMYNSVSLLNCGVAQLYTTDSCILIFQGGQKIAFTDGVKVKVLQPKSIGNENARLLAIKENGRGQIYDMAGEVVYGGKFDDASLMGDEYMVLGYGKKKGLISIDGNLLLKPFYDAIGNYNNGNVSILLNKKFGLFNQRLKVNIPPSYDKNLLPYNDNIFIANKSGKYGIVDKKSRRKTNFNFDQVKYWNDTSVLLKAKDGWLIYDFKNKKERVKGIKSVQYPTNINGEINMVFYQEGGYGVVSNKLGETIPPNFNDIVNIGSGERPIYFTEKHVKEADIFVVVYYDAAGKAIRKQAFSDKEYEKIYCGL